MAKIDDVDYLQKHSEKVSHIFYVDSKLRNKKAFPYPQEYVIEFAEPFRNVSGFQVLDVSLPRTMYNIDNHNNSISFSINNNPFKTMYLDDKDYDIDELIQQLTLLLKDEITENGRTIQVSISCTGLSVPAENKNLLSFSCQYPFVFDMKNSTVNEAIGFDLWATENSDRYSKIYSHQDQTHEQLFGSSQQSNVDLVEFQGPQTLDLVSVLGANYWVAQRFESELFQALKSVTVYIAKIGDVTGLSSNIQVEVWSHNSTENKPNQMVVSQVVTVNTFNGGSFKIDFDANTYGQNVTFQTGEIFWLVIKGVNYQTATNLYNPNVGTGSDTIGYYGIYYGAVSISVEDNRLDYTNTFSSYDGTSWEYIIDANTQNLPSSQVPLYQLNATITTQIQKYSITSPGLIQLTGERYVVLRCPEIEQHMYRSLSFGKYSPGIGVFKLGVMGFSDIRYDFSSVSSPNFHPIGKLDKLTFRFEKQDGTPYDFKGVNNTMLIAISYYQPLQKQSLNRSILNPDYQPDFMLSRHKIDYKQHSSDEDEDKDFPFQYTEDQKNAQLQRYLQLRRMNHGNKNVRFGQRHLQYQ